MRRKIICVLAIMCHFILRKAQGVGIGAESRAHSAGFNHCRAALLEKYNQQVSSPTLRVEFLLVDGMPGGMNIQTRDNFDVRRYRVPGRYWPGTLFLANNQCRVAVKSMVSLQEWGVVLRKMIKFILRRKNG